MAERFAWYVDDLDPKLASIRYRVLKPLAELQQIGFPIELYDPAKGPAAYRAVIFSKCQSKHGLDVFRSVKAAGGRVVYDICDNLFAAHRAGRASKSRLSRACRMLCEADALTFSTSVLQRQIESEVDGLCAMRIVVPDTLDTEDDEPGIPGRASRRSLRRLDDFLRTNDKALHAIWFGNSLGKVAGLAHLSRSVRRLEDFSSRHPITLTVMSNSRLSYLRQSWRWRVPSHYVPWSLELSRTVVARHRLSVIPVEHNDYTAGKTLNRPATALLAGLAVIADPIPSYTELAAFIELADWQRGLQEAAEWTGDLKNRIAGGQAHLKQRYSAEAVANYWIALLCEITA
jgi:hypothetical protein